MIPTAYEGTEKYVFISYAHTDRDEVYKVLYELEKNGIRFWYDDGIAPGSEWAEDIAQHLNASSAVMAIITNNSVKSSNCRREINYALSKEKPFLSVVLEKTAMSEGLEMQLSAQQSVIKYNYSSWDRFIDKVLSWQYLEDFKKTEEVPSEENLSATEIVPQKETLSEKLLNLPDNVSKQAAVKIASAVDKAKKKALKLRPRHYAIIGVAVVLAVLLAALHPWAIKTSWGKTIKKSRTDISVEDVTITQADADKLAKLSGLVWISFTNCDFSGCDLSALTENKPELHFIKFINCTGIEDYSFLNSCKPSVLSVTNALSFTDISLIDLSNAEEIDISGTGVDDISSLSTCSRLESLNISDTAVSSIDAVSSANELTTLYCDNCPIKTVGEVSSLRIKNLSMHGCGVSDFSAFKNCTLLTELNLGGNPGLKDVSWLDPQNYDHLEVLDLSESALDGSDLSFISSCYILKELNLDGVSIENLDFCKKLGKLESISAQGCGLKDISGLKGCFALRTVLLSFNDIESVSGLSSMNMSEDFSASVVLDLSYNRISDVSGLPSGPYTIILLVGNADKLAATIGEDVEAKSLAVDWYDDITEAPFAQTEKYRCDTLYVVGTPDSQKLKVEENTFAYHVQNITMDELYLDLLAYNKLDEYTKHDFTYAISLYKASK